MLIICIFIISIILEQWVDEEAELLIPAVTVGCTMLAFLADLLNVLKFVQIIMIAITVLLLGWFVFRQILRHEFLKTVSAHRWLVLMIAFLLIILAGYIISGVNVETESVDLANSIKSMYQTNRLNYPVSGMSILSPGLVKYFEYAFCKSIFMINDGLLLAAKNSFMLCMLVPLFSRQLRTIGDNSKVFFFMGISCVILLPLASARNELLCLDPYFTIGLMTGVLLFYFERFSNSKNKALLVCICIIAVGICFVHRIGYLVMISFVAAAAMYKVIYVVFMWDWKREISSRLAPLALFLISIIAAYLIRENIFCSDPFAKDVSNTFLSSLATTRRYSFLIFSNVAYIHFVLLSLLALAIIVYLTRAENSHFMDIVKVFIYFNCVSTIYVLALWTLYVRKFAIENIQNGEYLTHFEDYIQIPIVASLVLGATLFAKSLKKGKP